MLDFFYFAPLIHLNTPRFEISSVHATMKFHVLEDFPISSVTHSAVIQDCNE
jgi:hypothetical protein